MDLAVTCPRVTHVPDLYMSVGRHLARFYIYKSDGLFVFCFCLLQRPYLHGQGMTRNFEASVHL